MRLDRLPPNELASFVQNLITLLSGTELSMVDSNVRAALVAAFGSKPALLRTQTATAEVKKSEAKAAFVVRDATYGDMVTTSRQLQNQLRAVQADRSVWELCGLDYSDGSRSTYVAQTPTKISVEGFSNGVNKGRFTGNNRSGSINYEIFRRKGKDGDWMLHMTTSNPKFVDEEVTPGQYYEYKVRAKASKNTSQWSNTAVVYSSV